jgi:hypothetical protein
VCGALPSGMIMLVLFPRLVLDTLTRHALAASPQPVLGVTDEARVGDRGVLRIGVVRRQPNIDADHAAGGHMLDTALRLKNHLSVVTIGAADEPHTLDLVAGEGGQVACADQFHLSNATAIREGEMTSIRFELPTGGLVLDRSAVMLKVGIAFLAKALRLAVGIEASDALPSPICRGLAGLGVEESDKVKRMGKATAIDLQIVGADPAFIHPEAQALVADELGNANRFVNGGALRRGNLEFIFVEEHSAARLRAEESTRRRIGGRTSVCQEAIYPPAKPGGFLVHACKYARHRRVPDDAGGSSLAFSTSPPESPTSCP